MDTGPPRRGRGTGAGRGDTLTGRKLRTDRLGPPALSGQPGEGIEYARAPHETERPLNLCQLRMGRIRSAAESMAARRTQGDLRKLAASFPERRQSWEEARGDSARLFTGSAGTGGMRPEEGWGPAIFDEVNPLRESAESLKEKGILVPINLRPGDEKPGEKRPR